MIQLIIHYDFLKIYRSWYAFKFLPFFLFFAYWYTNVVAPFKRFFYHVFFLYTLPLHVVVIIISLNHVWLFCDPWTVTHQAPLFFTVSWSLLIFMSTELVMLFNHLSFCLTLLLFPSVIPALGPFPMSQCFTSIGQYIGVSASVLPKNIQWIFRVDCLISIYAHTRIYIAT